MSAVDPSVASTIPLFVTIFRTSRGAHLRCYAAFEVHFREASGSSLWIYFYQIVDAKLHARRISERPPEANCGFISINLMARQTPSSSRNVCCGSQRSIDNSTFCNYFLHVSGANPRNSAHTRCRRAAKKRGPWELILYYILASQETPHAA